MGQPWGKSLYIISSDKTSKNPPCNANQSWRSFNEPDTNQCANHTTVACLLTSSLTHAACRSLALSRHHDSTNLQRAHEHHTHAMAHKPVLIPFSEATAGRTQTQAGLGKNSLLVFHSMNELTTMVEFFGWRACAGNCSKSSGKLYSRSFALNRLPTFRGTHESLLSCALHRSLHTFPRSSPFFRVLFCWHLPTLHTMNSSGPHLTTPRLTWLWFSGLA